MFPLWQVSFDTKPSNGSTHWPASNERDNNTPNKWWMDCNIEMQFLCEAQLNNPKSSFSVLFKGTVYLIDLEHMTQLNTYKGCLRKLRRMTLDQLQNGCIKIGHVEKDDMCERAHKMRRKF